MRTFLLYEDICIDKFYLPTPTIHILKKARLKRAFIVLLRESYAATP